MSAVCSTSGSRCLASARPGAGRPGRQRLVVRAADKMCRDVVSVPSAPYQSKGETYKITFLGAGDEARVVDCADDTYILDAAEAAGLDLPATCRGGICGACVGRVVAGGVDMSDVQDLSFTLTDEEVEAGMALICMARPKGDVSIETQCDWGYSLGITDWKGAGKFTSSPDPLMGTVWSESAKN
jgi:2Fe-2S type ferredoxin